MKIRVTIPSALDEVGKVDSSVSSLLEKCACSDKVIFDIKLALAESVSNAIRYGNKQDECKFVDVDVEITDDKIVMTITDKGDGFDYNHLPDCTAPENLELPCGRGIALMKFCMDEVKFNSKGNSVTMIKNRECCSS